MAYPFATRIATVTINRPERPRADDKIAMGYILLT